MAKKVVEKPEVQKQAQGYSKKVIILFFALLGTYVIVQAGNHMLNLHDDNLVEESIEYGVQATTGMNVDLTPGSVE